MRNLSFLMLLLISTACSTDTVGEFNDGQNDVIQSHIAKKTGVVDNIVANASNPYDHIGEAYLSLLDNYESVDPKPESSSDVMELLETIGGDIGFLSTDYTPESLLSIDTVQQLSIDDLNLALSQSGLSSGAQSLLLNCITGLLYLKEQDASYDEAYAYLVNFESAVQASNLSSDEKEILLSTLSIVRYDIYNSSARKKKDRDWELSVGNFMATAYGAKKSQPNAIISAGISNILH